MKRSILIIGIAVISCCSAKKTTDDTGKTGNDTPDVSIPSCVKQLIVQFKHEEKQNPPRSIYSYIYKEKTVYYVPAVCCDFFSDLYDDKCNIIGHPDGGFTGRGDGKITDFKEARKKEKLIWKDERK